MTGKRLLLAMAVALGVAGYANAAELCPAIPATSPLPRPAVPTPLDIPGWAQASAAIDASLARVDRSSFGLVFVGDSITASWDKPIFSKFFGPFMPLLLGIGGDRTEGMLYRLPAELAGMNPQVVMLLAGTNNAGSNRPEAIAQGIAALIRLVHARVPNAKILVLALLPRGVDPTDRLRQVNDGVNALVQRCADGKTVFYVDESARLLDANGVLTQEISHDHLHLTPTGYYKLAEGLQPEIARLMGPK